MKILLVAMAESIHTARWVAQLPVDEWDVHVFPSTAAGGAHPDLRGVTFHGLLRAGAHPGIRERGLPVPHSRLASLGEEAADRLLPWLRPSLLARLVRSLRPDVVHSLEFQHSSYLTLDARERSGDAFPPWIVTNWGSDIQRFGQDPAHAPRIRRVLRSCDAYTCECERDVRAGPRDGLHGPDLPPVAERRGVRPRPGGRPPVRPALAPAGHPAEGLPGLGGPGARRARGARGRRRISSPAAASPSSPPPRRSPTRRARSPPAGGSSSRSGRPGIRSPTRRCCGATGRRGSRSGSR